MAICGRPTKERGKGRVRGGIQSNQTINPASTSYQSDQTTKMLPDTCQTSDRRGILIFYITKTIAYKVIDVSKTRMTLPITYQTSYEVGEN